jgi:hypothetical protein
VFTSVVPAHPLGAPTALNQESRIENSECRDNRDDAF